MGGTLWEYLQTHHPGLYPRSVLRTLQLRGSFDFASVAAYQAFYR
jgi:hypothetical protein